MTERTAPRALQRAVRKRGGWGHSSASWMTIADRRADGGMRIRSRVPGQPGTQTTPQRGKTRGPVGSLKRGSTVEQAPCLPAYLAFTPTPGGAQYNGCAVFPLLTPLPAALHIMKAVMQTSDDAMPPLGVKSQLVESRFTMWNIGSGSGPAAVKSHFAACASWNVRKPGGDHA